MPEPVLDLSHEAIGKQQADYNSRVGFFQSRPNAGQKAGRGPKTSAVQKAPIGQQQTHYNSLVGRTQNRPNVAQNTPMGFYTESGYAMGEGAYAAGRMGSTIGKGMTPTQQAQYAEGAGMRSGEELGMLVAGGAGVMSTSALSLAAGYIGNALMLGPIAEASILSAPLVGEGMVLGTAIQKGLGIVKSRLGFFERGGAGAESLATRRAYLDAKFGRTGNLHNDITLRGYMQDVEKLDVSTSRDSAIFYSGDGNRGRAEEFARTFNKTTLEMTPGGKYLDNQLLSQRLPRELAIKPWERLSQRYAQSASGDVYAFARDARAGSVFNTIELPALNVNPEVTNIFYRETPYLYETRRFGYAS